MRRCPSGTVFPERHFKLRHGRRRNYRYARLRRKETGHPGHSRNTLVGKQIRTIESIEAVSIYDRLDIPNDYFDDHFLVGVYVTPGKTAEESREDFKNYAQKNDLEVHPNFFVEKDGVFYVLLRGARYKLDAIGDYAYTFCVRVPPLKKA